MAVVIHTRKGKYQYAYEHTREGDKVISRYMHPVNKEGDKIKQYQREVAQQPEQKEIAQQKREIEISKPVTYEGVKEIQIRYDPFINSAFNPVGETYIIKKYKDDKKWQVYIQGKYTGGKEGYRTENKYIGIDTLKNCKKYCINKLEVAQQK